MSDRKSDTAVSLDQLRTFLAVHRAGTVTDGARAIGIAQATASAQLRALESRLGYSLFERLPRGVTATPAADELAARLSPPLDEVTHIVAGLDGRSTSAPQPAVRLGGPADFLATEVLPALTADVTDGLRLHTVLGLADDLLDMVRSGRLDLAISSIRPRGRTLLAEPLIDEEFVLVASPDLAEALGDVRDARDVSGVPLVSYAADLPIIRRYWRHVFGVRLEAEAAVVVPDLRTVATVVAGGAGISVLPRYLCRTRLERGDLVILLDSEDPPINTVYLVYGPGRGSLPHVARVADRLRFMTTRWKW